MIRIENLSKSFVKNSESDLVLDYVNMDIEYGKITGFIGNSGEGKSTLVRVMAGEFRPDCGNVYIDDTPLIVKGKYNRKIGRNIQVIPQQPYLSLDSTQSVGNAIKEVLTANKIYTSKEAKRETYRLLEEVKLANDLYYRLPDQLSGGQSQRIAIARAMAAHPKLLISDEATSMLDVISQAQIINIFKKLRDNGLSILLISHDKSLIKYACDKAYAICGGKVNLIDIDKI